MARQGQDTSLWALWQGAVEDGDDGLRRLLETVSQRVLEEELTKSLDAEVRAWRSWPLGKGYPYVVVDARYPKVARLLDEHGEEMLAVYHLPAAHRKRMRSTNLLERTHQELCRRTRVVRIFPDEASCLRLVTAPAIEQSEERQDRRYLDLSLAAADDAGGVEAEAAG